MPATVFIENVDTVAAATTRLARALRLPERIPRGADAYIKLNLAADDARANTSLETVETVVGLLRRRTTRIHLCEADAIRWTAEEAFARNGYTRWARGRDVRLVNLSREAPGDPVDPRMRGFGLPRRLLAEDKVFITLPMIKTHHLTTFTGAIKNQWGTIPRVDRILLHRHLDDLLPVINRRIGVDFAIMGGEWAMEGRGPTNGRLRRFPVMLASTAPASLDATAMRLIGLRPADCRHLRFSDDDTLGRIDADDIEVVGDFSGLRQPFEPARFDWASRAGERLARHPLFVHRVLLNRPILAAARRAADLGRRMNLVR